MTITVLGSAYAHKDSFAENNHTLSVTVPDGTDLLLFFAQVNRDNWAQLTGPTVNGSATGVVQAGTTPGSLANRSIRAWYVLSPTAGTYNIEWDYSTSSENAGGVMAMYLSGVDLTTPISAAANSSTGSGASPLSTAITVASGGMAVAGAYADTSLPTPNGSQTTVGTTENGHCFSYKSDATAMSVTFTGSPQISQLVVAVKPAIASTPVSFSGTVPTRNGTIGAAASFANAGFFAGSLTPFAYTLQSGTLPAGLTLNSSTGVISGTPTTAGTQSGITIRATDASSNTATTNAYAIVIAATNASPTFPGSIGNITGSATLAITPVNVTGQFSDTDALTFTASPAGTAWPSGLVVNSSTGIISGTIASASTTSGLKVRATDTAAQTVDSNAFSVTIGAAPASGSFTTRKLGNNTSTGLPAGTAVVWAWREAGRFAAEPASSTYGTGTLDSGGLLTITGCPAGAGYVEVRKTGASAALDAVYVEFGTVA